MYLQYYSIYGQRDLESEDSKPGMSMQNVGAKFSTIDSTMMVSMSAEYPKLGSKIEFVLRPAETDVTLLNQIHVSPWKLQNYQTHCSFQPFCCSNTTWQARR